ncbi:MAG TPA: carbamoyltransferase [Candidatus Brocadiia bacterium]|nr:carbamoyltransferase [Candidatus Brocadiia bacterium]
MSKHILGISAFYHDSAAALVRDGDIVAAAQEERFTRKKHDPGFPARAVEYCLREAGIGPDKLDVVAFYDKPILKFERLLETYLAYAPRGLRSFWEAMPEWMETKLHIPRKIEKALGKQFNGDYIFTEHHESHAAAAFFPSQFPEAAILTVDGVGEWATTTWGVGRGNRVEIREQISFPHSLGMLYSAFTYYLGFRVNSGEYKVMGLAPYGEPRFADLILKELIDLREDGSFRLNMRYFGYCDGLTMTNARFHNLFGMPPRKPDEWINQTQMDIAASIQQVTEEVMLRLARHVHGKSGMKHLCLAGGCSLNCVANGRMLREGPFDDIFIQPAAGDAGGALGAALFAWHQFLGNDRNANGRSDTQKGSLLGPAFGSDEIADHLRGIAAPFHRFEQSDELCEKVAELLIAGKAVGLCAGRMEFGPRALGCRSILGDARSESMQSMLNLKIKFRESFRPFAPVVLEENVSDYFELDRPSPYMLLVAPVLADKRLPVANEMARLQGTEKLKVKRSVVPAVTHVDFSARIQTVDETRHGLLCRLMRTFREKTGCPVLVNTSFNIRGEPIVCSPQDAYRCFMFTDMDALVLEDVLLLKEEQPPMKGAEEYKRSFLND